MRHTRLGILLGLLSLLIAPAVAFSQEGTVEVGEITSAALEDNLIGDSATRSFAIYLPPSYETSQRWYPVFYSLTGYGITASKSLAWIQGSIRLEMDKAIRNGDIGEIIVVFLDGYNKFGGSYYLSSPTTGDWETYIVRDVVDYVDTHYRTIPHRNSRVIDGYSMGGFGAMHLALKYPGVFSVVVAQAGLYDFSADFGTGKTGPWEAGATAWVDPRTWDEFASLDWRTQAWFAIAAATAPNPDRPPFFLDKPHALVDGQPQIVPEVFKRMVDKDVVRDLERYVRQPVRLKGIKIVHGTADDIVPVEQARILDRKLTDVGIDHVYVEHGGGHDTFLNESLAFFSAHLQVVPVETPAVVSAPTALGSVVAGQPIPLEVTVVLDAPLESTQARMTLNLPPSGVPSELPLSHVGGGRYTGSTTLTALQTGRYSLPVMVDTEEGEPYGLLRLALDVYPGEDLSIYEDGPGDGWSVEVSRAESDVTSSAFVHSGNASHAILLGSGIFPGTVKYAFDNPTGIDPFGYDHLEFYINGGEASGQDPAIGDKKLSELGIVPQPDTWVWVSIPVSEVRLDQRGRFTSVVISGVVKQTFYIDDMKLVAQQPPEPTSIRAWEERVVPSGYALFQNVPNPFNPLTAIAYDLPNRGDVTLTLYALTGQKVGTLVSDHQEAGHYQVVWNGSGFANGVYVYHLTAGSFAETKRMLLLK